MDEMVKRAMAKWPNVPHCYGWLALDARGNWRMRDERAQAMQMPGDRIAHAALIGFINRNYTHDEQGRWYFQNGPQRVYVNLEATPYIVQTDSAHGFTLHTGEPMPAPDAAWMTDDGHLVLQSEDKVAMLDDRDLAQCLARLNMNTRRASDEDILEWLEQKTTFPLTLSSGATNVPLQRIRRSELAPRFGFIPVPVDDRQSNALP